MPHAPPGVRDHDVRGPDIQRGVAMSLNDTPRSDRLHIGIFGRRNAGKSSLLNAFTGRKAAIVSETAGTTTDPVYKSMEIHGLGPCVLIDTAGFDDEGPMGELRVRGTEEALKKTDAALVVIALDALRSLTDEELSAALAEERNWLVRLVEKRTPALIVLNKADTVPAAENGDTLKELAARVAEALDMQGGGVNPVAPVPISAATGRGMDALRDALARLVPENWNARSITGGMASDGDLVLLVMPQDIQAPQGRLILPQVQTIRDLLDRKCLIMSVTTDRLDAALDTLVRPPKLIITDSQVFGEVYAKKPAGSRLTSFSVLMAGYKGDIDAFAKGARALGRLGPDSRVLIAEACAHAPLPEDIGRVKIPRLLRNRFGEKLHIEWVRGTDFPENLSGYDLVIHCGACMFNRTYMLGRQEHAAAQGVPMTNYGVALAWLAGILDRIDLK